MRKLIELKNGGACIDISPLTDIDIGRIIAERENLLLENMLDGEIRRRYNPGRKQPIANYVIKKAASRNSFAA